MRAFLAAVVLLVSGWLLYYYLSPPQEPIPVIAAPAPRDPVPFHIRSLIRMSVDDLKKIQTGEIKGKTAEHYREQIGKRLSEIRAYLHRQKKFDEASLSAMVLHAVQDLGYSPDQAQHLNSAIMSQSINTP